MRARNSVFGSHHSRNFSRRRLNCHEEVAEELYRSWLAMRSCGQSARIVDLKQDCHQMLVERMDP
jgi:hypothetical protein